jgi:F-type H+-transporting ATPase subunit delta
MTMRASAARYARALLDVAVQESIADRAGEDLTAFADLVQRHPELQRVLTSPAVPAPRKRALVQGLLERLSLSTPVGKLLTMLADRDRLVLLPDLVAVYRERLMERHRIIEAEVTTAAPLGQEEAAGLQQRLAHATGRQVTMSTKVDPSIIGGLVARLGTVVYDGSVATQLQAIRQRLTDEA